MAGSAFTDSMEAKRQAAPRIGFARSLPVERCVSFEVISSMVGGTHLVTVHGVPFFQLIII